MSTGIARAREELFAAHLLGTTGFAAQTVGLAFRAALAAAEAALMLIDKPPAAEPAVVVAAFVRHVVRERGMDPDAGRVLRSLYNRQLQAATDGAVPQPEAPQALTDATTVIDMVDEWITTSRRVAQGRGPTRPRRSRSR